MMPRKGEKGFTLVELMVAMLISIFLLWGIINVFMSSKRSYVTRDGLSVIQENGRVAIRRLREGLSPAGYPTFEQVLPVVLAHNLPDEPNVSISSDNDAGDQVTIAYQASGDIYVTDCLGHGSNIRLGDTVMNSFFLEDGSLKCEGSNGSNQPLADGIENMQVLYGVDMNFDGVPEQYITATALENVSPVELQLGVVSIRIALLVKSIEKAKEQIGTPRTYNLLGTTITEPADLYMRRVFTTTIPLRNRMQQR